MRANLPRIRQTAKMADLMPLNRPPTTYSNDQTITSAQPNPLIRRSETMENMHDSDTAEQTIFGW